MATAEMAISPNPLREPSYSRADWERVIDELLKIRNLQDDWDGEGGIAPLPGMVDFAIALAISDRDRGAPAPDRVHAGVNATVYFEWHSPAGYCELEILSPVDAESRSLRNGSDRTEVVRLSRRTCVST